MPKHNLVSYIRLILKYFTIIDGQYKLYFYLCAFLKCVILIPYFKKTCVSIYVIDKCL